MVYAHNPRGAIVSSRGRLWAALATVAVLLQCPVDAQEWNRSPKEVQQALVELGFKLGAVDGVWGKKSGSALKAFQKAQGLSETGVLDEATAAKLFAPNKEFAESILKHLGAPTAAAAAKSDSPPASNSAPASQSSTEGQQNSNLDKMGSSLDLPSGAAAPGKTDPVGISTQKPDGIRGADSSAQASQPKPTINTTSESVRQSLAGDTRTSAANARMPNLSVPAQVARSTGLPSQKSSGSSGITPFGYAVFGIIGFVLLRKLFSGKRSSQPLPVQTQPPPLSTANVAQRSPSPPRPTLKTTCAHPTVAPSRQWQPAPSSKPAASSPPSTTKWVPAGTEVRVGNHVIRGGMVYVGGFLPKKGALHENENCLINPQLPVGRNGDPMGVTMGYWPAYGHITPEARKSYLEWLAGDRSDPDAYIGYVFLYFYGLERRLLLDRDPNDAPQVLMEVRRLLTIYGDSGSFRRYAAKLISAYELKTMSYSQGFDLGAENNSYEVPISVKVALGQRLETGTPVEPDLLLAYVMTHPETQVRTPAKRVEPSLLKRMFADELENRFPKGVRISGKSGRKLRLDYHACSGTFDLEIKPFGLDLIDVTERKQPIEDARIAFEACVEKLDAYSRALGKSNGLKPKLTAVAKLPAPYRLEEACRLSDQPLVHLYEWSNEKRSVKIEDLAALAGMPKDKPITRAFVSELSATLAGVGFGHTGDPDFATKSPKIGDTVIVFPLTGTPSMPTAAYKPAQLMALLGLLMAFADGELQPQELSELHARIDGEPDLSIDERQRLKAELTVGLEDPRRLDDFAKKLKDVDPNSRARIADTLIAMATADGTIHPDEVRQLERLFRLMSLDAAALYAHLHNGAVLTHGEMKATNDDDIPEIIPPDQAAATIPIPPPPLPSRKTSIRVDASRLEAIREETRMAAELLSDIFADDAEPTPEPLPVEIDEPEAAGDLFEGLERRYGALLLELRVRGEWAADEFGRLAREAGLMPAAVINALNDWALDLFGELLLEGEDPIAINLELLPLPAGSGASSEFDERVTS